MAEQPKENPELQNATEAESTTSTSQDQKPVMAADGPSDASAADHQ